MTTQIKKKKDAKLNSNTKLPLMGLIYLEYNTLNANLHLTI